MTNGNIIKFRGVLTSYEYAAPPQDKSGKKKHRIGIKVNADDMATLKAEIKDAGVYAKSPEGFIPKWYKEASEYVNLSSAYDIRTLYWDADHRDVESTLSDMYADLGIVTGSDVVVACTLKEGAIYPTCIAFKSMRVVSMADLFDEEDGLPFK